MRQPTYSVLIVLALPFFFMGCFGHWIHRAVTYDSIQATIKENNEHLLSLQVGRTREQVRGIMGDPERSEGYAWGSAWLYRTAMTSGIYGTVDSDFTPVVFDSDGSLVGWGRNFFTEHVKRFEIQIRYD